MIQRGRPVLRPSVLSYTRQPIGDSPLTLIRLRSSTLVMVGKPKRKWSVGKI